jgi:hypothetical protein
LWSRGRMLWSKIFVRRCDPWGWVGPLIQCVFDCQTCVAVRVDRTRRSPSQPSGSFAVPRASQKPRTAWRARDAIPGALRQALPHSCCSSSEHFKAIK